MPGDTIRLTLDLNHTVTVSGTPVLLLNDGGTATYVSGSGTNALTFANTVSIHDATVPTLAVTQVDLPNGAIVQNAAGTSANLAGAVTTLSGLGIDPPETTPAVTQVVANPGGGHEGIGSTISITVGLDEAVIVTGGTPTLTLNDGGVATYDAAASKALNDPTKIVFSYTVSSHDTNTSALAVTGAILNGAAITDARGNNANFAMVPTTFSGLHIDTTPVAASLAATDVGAAAAVQSDSEMSTVVALFHQYVASSFGGTTASSGAIAQAQTGLSDASQLLIPAFKAARLMNA
jgi:hypothetical protein